MKDILEIFIVPFALVLLIVGLILLQVKTFWEIISEQFSKN